MGPFKCPDCGTWWAGTEHRCPPPVTAPGYRCAVCGALVTPGPHSCPSTSTITVPWDLRHTRIVYT